jgi:hypothetical protein
MQTERLKWFENYKNKNHLTSESILNFHKTAGQNNKEFGTIMDRGSVKTTSITQIKKTDTDVEMRYESLHDHNIAVKTLNTVQTVNG